MIYFMVLFKCLMKDWFTQLAVMHSNRFWVSFVWQFLSKFNIQFVNSRWLFPFVGHMGIATSAGVIRDFAGPYYVGEGQMAFGKPTRYLQMDPTLAAGGASGWDRGVAEASEIYKHRIHNLFCDNCHSHTATALDHMQYQNRNNWNMVKLASMMFFKGSYVGFKGFCITWIPSLLLIILIVILLTLSSSL